MRRRSLALVPVAFGFVVATLAAQGAPSAAPPAQRPPILIKAGLIVR